MGIKYDKYINRLKMKRGNDPYYGKVREAAAAFAEPTMAMNREVQGRINTAGGSIGAMEQTRQNAQHQMIQGQKEMIATIPRADTGAIDQQIMELEMRRDAERDQGKDNALKTGLQIGGTVLGAAVGTVVAPGPGTLLGAQIGAGLGSTASGFVGGGGDMGMNHASPEVIAQGVADTLEGVSSSVALKDQKALSKSIGTTYKQLTLEDKELMLGALRAGNLDIVKSILAQYKVE
jgi:hypothetical protein